VKLAASPGSLAGHAARALGAAAIGLLAPATAHAHLVNTGLGPFYDGVTHLLLTPEDLLPAFALALLAGQQGPRGGRLVLLALPSAWVMGGLAGLAVPRLDSAALLTTASLLLLGGLVAAERHIPSTPLASLAIVVGSLHGYLNGAAMAQARLGALGVIGIVSALFVLVALAAAAVVAIRAPWGRIAVRVAGSWMVAIGLLLLGWSLRQAAR
jgi:hydrogenase/urease accessory protein HupE